jgi:hypothetical protein
MNKVSCAISKSSPNNKCLSLRLRALALKPTKRLSLLRWAVKPCGAV